MNLENLIEWTKKLGDKETLRPIVRKDIKGVPIEGDISVGLSFLKEIEKRVDMVKEHAAKAKRFRADIDEYLKELEKRGIVYKEKIHEKSDAEIP